MRILLIPLLLIALTSCAPPTVNLQLSAIRSAGDISATTYLDERDLSAVPKRIDEIGQFSKKVAEFLATGNAAKLAETKLKDLVLKMIPSAYQPIADGLLDSLAKRKLNVDVDKIGEANVARIQAFFLGCLTATEKYRTDLRKAEEEKIAREEREKAEGGGDSAATEGETPSDGGGPAETPEPSERPTSPGG
jgi:hypothetical protein